MKNLTNIIIAMVMGSAALGVVQVKATLPVGKVLRAETGPAERVTLQNGVVTQVVRLTGLDAGTWLVWGACTVQDTMRQGVAGEYLYTYSAISMDQFHMPGGGLQSLDARPYSTKNIDDHQNLFWWFATNPPPRVFHFTGDPTLYLIAESVVNYGEIPPSLSQAFGTIIALKTSL